MQPEMQPEEDDMCICGHPYEDHRRGKECEEDYCSCPYFLFTGGDDAA